ncbi:MAG: hypothetical protein AABW89_04745 [Nanoarchaeota archaeon]
MKLQNWKDLSTGNRLVYQWADKRFVTPQTPRNFFYMAEQGYSELDNFPLMNLPLRFIVDSKTGGVIILTQRPYGETFIHGPEISGRKKIVSVGTDLVDLTVQHEAVIGAIKFTPESPKDIIKSIRRDCILKEPSLMEAFRQIDKTGRTFEEEIGFRGLRRGLAYIFLISDCEAEQRALNVYPERRST